MVLVSCDENTTTYATEIKISLISNPHDCTDDFINNLLQNYFTVPRYLRMHDIFTINVKKYYPESKYCTADSKLDLLHFRINSIKTENKKSGENGAFVVYGKTTVIQENNIHSYIPCKCICDICFDSIKCFHSTWPLALKEPLEYLQSCIAPFLQKSNVPTFLNKYF